MPGFARVADHTSRTTRSGLHEAAICQPKLTLRTQVAIGHW
jgi:hypothetical protein